ncbi:TPA: DUF6056 family protein [Streptococcus suis]
MWFIILGFLFFALLFHLNRLTLFTSDDYTYHYVYKGYMPNDDSERIHGLFSIIKSQINHWKLWNGRFVAHFIVQFWLQFNKIYFDIFNSLAYIIVLLLTLSISKVKEVERIQPVTCLLLFIFFWFNLPEIGKSVLWVSGSGNYLWTSIIYLSYFYVILQITGKNISKLSILGIILLGFLAGACNENSSPTILLMSLIYIVTHLPYKNSGTLTGFISLISGTLGFLLMLKSPGSQERGKVSITVDILLKNFKVILTSLLQYYWVAYLIIALLILLLIIRKIKLSRDTRILLLVLTIGHFASAFVLMISPEFPKRTLFGTVLFLAMILFILLNILIDLINRQLLIVITIPLIVLFSISYFTVNQDLTKSFNEVSSQYETLQNSPKNSDVKIPLLSTPKTDYNAYLLTNNLKTDPNDWFNRWMAKYFEKNSISGY